MKPHSEDRWRQIEALLDEALDLDADARDALLDRACAGDPELRRDVERLLKADAEAPSFLDAPAADYAVPLFPDAPKDQEQDLAEQHRLVGPYRIVQELGRGGMGVVYRAERADGVFEQQVALKLLRQGLDTDDAERRFRTERRILASLRHPHIARLLDGGVTDDGMPYLVMEYIEGSSITDYCDAHRLSIDQRLGLFEQVCRAVQYAHRNLVVHRDLKPSNILVTEEDDAPQVKLLDFGIAKLLDEDGAFTAVVTRTGARLMTPEYASPEQIKGEAITTATDVYQLGVLLYELLTGRRPYRLERRKLRAVAEAILEEEPTRPSAVVTQVEPLTEPEVTPERVSQARSTALERLRRRLAGDLDVICLKALRKEPERRYDSAAALAEDLRRHLAGLPVAARGDTAGYRLRKFMLRHRWGVAATAAVMLALLSGLGVALWQAQVVRDERDQARLEREKAEQVTTYMAGIFNRAHPENAQGDTLNVFDVLALGVADLDSGLTNQPEVQAALMEVMGQIYLEMGTLNQAKQLFERSLDLREQLHGREHADVASSMYSLAQVLWQEGAYEAADSLNRLTLDLQRKLLDDEHPDVIWTMNNLGTVWHTQGRFAEAESLYRQVLPISQQIYGETGHEYLYHLNNLANSLFAQGKYEEARTYLQQILDTRRQLFGETHPDVAFSMDNLAWTLHTMGEHEAAAALARRALDLQRRVLGAQHPNIPWTLGTLASALMAQDRLDTAAVLMQEGLHLRREILGDDHPDLVLSYNALTRLALQQRDGEAAETYARQEYALAQEVLGPRHPSTATGLQHLGLARRLNGDLDGAVTALQTALEMKQDLLGDDHPQTLRCREQLNQALQERNK